MSTHTRELLALKAAKLAGRHIAHLHTYALLACRLDWLSQPFLLFLCAHGWQLVQAKGLGSLGSAQQELLTVAAGLPIILTAENTSSTDDVWKGIELGAAEVLEKPLSSLKLRNIWQHVVRKVCVCVCVCVCV